MMYDEMGGESRREIHKIVVTTADGISVQFKGAFYADDANAYRLELKRAGTDSTTEHFINGQKCPNGE